MTRTEKMLIYYEKVNPELYRRLKYLIEKFDLEVVNVKRI